MFARLIVILRRTAQNLVLYIFILRYWRSFASLRMTNWGLWGYLTEQANCNASVGGDDSAPRCRGGFPRPPVDFDVICPSVTRFARATSPTSGEVCGTVKTVPYGCRGRFTLLGEFLCRNRRITPKITPVFLNITPTGYCIKSEVYVYLL